MKMYYKKAKPVSYDTKKARKKEDTVEYIVIHYTGGTKDTSANNVDYFANGNERSAGAHFFVDQDGKIGRSVPMNNVAWAVGDSGKGKLCGKVTNYNSVSIELCSIAEKEPSEKMVVATLSLIKHIQHYCPKVKAIVRHYDVTGKSCPAPMVKEEAWDKFLKRLDEWEGLLKDLDYTR